MSTDEARRDHARLGELTNSLAGAEGERRERLLGKLREELHAHFRHEEEPGGWIAQALAAAPHHAAQLDALRQQHHDLMATAARLARGGDDDEVQAFVDALAEHERREAALLSEIWYDETGAGD